MLEPMNLVVRAGLHDRLACPVWVQLPRQDAVPALRLTDETGAEVPCQAEPSGAGDDDRLWLTWIVRDLAAGQERRYRLEEAPSLGAATDRAAGEAVPDNPGAAGVGEEIAPGVGDAPEDVDQTLHRADTRSSGVALNELPDGQLSVHIDGEHVTTYYFGSDVVRPYFHPVIGPTGHSVTRGYPMVPAPEGAKGYPYDHPHHRGFWVAHGDVNGADNWSEGPSHATMRHAGFSRIVSGPVYASFDETVEWLDRDGRIVMTETRRVTFFNIGRDERLFDVSLRFSASAGTVTFGDTKEGGLIAIRLASSMDGPEARRPDAPGVIENAYGGLQEGECWGKRANWVDYSGPVEGETVGVCMMDHPTNPRYPTHWHVRAYGLFTANPFGLHDFYKDPDTHRGDWTIPAYEARNFLYRVLIHRGNAAQGAVRERYHDFVNLPVVELVA
jgi:hypothetical protein